MTNRNAGGLNSDLRILVDGFVTRLAVAVQIRATERVQAALLSALGAGGALGLPRRRGRPPKNRPGISSAVSVPAARRAPRRRRPKQFCPVPGCKNVAAPIFGMVCSSHKGVAKDQIAKYRADRRAAKTKPGARARKG